MRMKTKITLLYKKYPKNIRDAYMKIIALEANHKSRSSKENEDIQKRIEAIIKEASNEV